jgi:hypothetical protein
MSPISKGLASFAVAAVLSTAAAAQGLVTQKNIPLAMAQTIANAALTKCESMGFKVSVVVVDRDGLPIVMLRGDGSGLLRFALDSSLEGTGFELTVPP